MQIKALIKYYRPLIKLKKKGTAAPRFSATISTPELVVRRPDHVSSHGQISPCSACGLPHHPLDSNTRLLKQLLMLTP